MIEIFFAFHEHLEKNTLKISNPKIFAAIHDYSFYYVTEKFDDNQKQQIYQNIQDSKVVIISKYKEENQNTNIIYFIICFKKTIILTNQTSLPNLSKLFSYNKNLIIYFLTETKDIFNSIITLQNKQIEFNPIFKEEILSFNRNIGLHPSFKASTRHIYDIIRSCMTGYLIKQGYSKLNKNRNLNFNENLQNENFEDLDYIWLRNIGKGSSFTVNLIYHIEKEELFAIKIPNGNNFSEYQNLLQREIENYSEINYPLLPKFHGTVQKKTEKCPVVEFIDGNLLSNIKSIQLNENEKIRIIFQIIMEVNYLHKRQFVYRDLKPNNILIDHNKQAVIIDFDRMLKFY